MIILGILVVIAGVGIMWLWQYAYTPQGRARVIIAQLRGDRDTTLRGWLLQHHVVRQGFPVPPEGEGHFEIPASEEMVKLGPSALPVVIEALGDDNLDVRLMAIRACGKFRDPAAIQPLDKYMCEERFKEDTRLMCLEVLIDIGPEAYGTLLKHSRWLNDKDLCTILEILTQKRAGEALLPHLNAGSMYVARRAALCLCKIGDRKVIPSLVNTLKDQHVDRCVRIPIAVALAQMDRDEGLTYLVALLRSPEASDRAHAAEQLANTPVKGTFDPLLSLLADKDDWYLAGRGIEGEPRVIIRGLAALALGELHDPRAIPGIKKLLNDPDPEVRKAAAEALEKLGAKLPPDSQPDNP